MLIIHIVLIILCLLEIIKSVPTRQANLFISSTADKRALKKSLGYVEDAYLNFTELTNKYGYKSEEHIVTTEDGYQLTIFRIISKCPQVNRFPIILGHGIGDSSDLWILLGPETGLGYILSNNCYDVWAANFRGNVYSRKHLNLNPDKDQTYWQFSFDETGNYDLPALIDYVLGATRHSKLYYIGHSQGATDFLAMGSLKPDYNEKVHLAILIAPVAWMKNIRVPILKAFPRHAEHLAYILKDAGINEVFSKTSIIHTVIELICQFVPNEVCGTALAVATGYRLGSIDSKKFAIVVGHVPVGTSVKNLAHFAQSVVSKDFRRYDEGESGNIQRYGVTTPPKYDVSLITANVVIISAENDWLSTLKDIKILTTKLPNFVENYVVKEPTWSHNNHLWGVNATQLVFDRILYYLQTFDTR